MLVNLIQPYDLLPPMTKDIETRANPRQGFFYMVGVYCMLVAVIWKNTPHKAKQPEDNYAPGTMCIAVQRLLGT